MRVLVLNYEYPPLGGGAANATYYILRELCQISELEIDLVTSSASRYRVEHPKSNLTVHYLDINKRGSLHYQTMGDLLTFSWKSHFYAHQLIARRNFHLIHAFFGIPSGFTAMQFDLPYIVSLRGSDVPFYNERFRLLDQLAFKRLSRRIWARAAMVVANSKGLRGLARQTAKDQAISVIPNGVDTERYCPPKNKRCERKKIRVVSTGRLIERKGYEFLIEALSGKPEFELVLVGDGDRREILEDMARQAGLGARFTGRLEREDVVEHLQGADLFVLPSLNEGMSNSILEALACGLPVIATRVGGCDELVREGENGFVVERGSARALSEALGKYANDRSLLNAHSMASRKIAVEMNWERVSRDYWMLYEKVAETSGGAGRCRRHGVGEDGTVCGPSPQSL